MNENTRYQYNIEVVDAELNSTIGSKVVKTVDEAINVLGYDTNLWIQEYERDKQRHNEHIDIDEIQTEDECDFCGQKESLCEFLPYKIDGKTMCTRCSQKIEELETMTPEEELAEEQIYRTCVYDGVATEQQSSRKPHTQTI